MPPARPCRSRPLRPRHGAAGRRQDAATRLDDQATVSKAKLATALKATLRFSTAGKRKLKGRKTAALTITGAGARATVMLKR